MTFVSSIAIIIPTYAHEQVLFVVTEMCLTDWNCDFQIPVYSREQTFYNIVWQ